MPVHSGVQEYTLGRMPSRVLLTFELALGGTGNA